MTGWNPWRALRQTNIELWFADLTGARGLWTRTGQGEEIVLESNLDRRQRREVLAHELVHSERGVGWPVATADTMALEEERVWRTALRRLVPADEVRRFLEARSSVGPVTVADLAEEFDLSPIAAERYAKLWSADAADADGPDEPDSVSG
jgi:hypothetical protein